MQKLIISLASVVLMAGTVYSQPTQAKVELDATSFVRDIDNIQVELYYSIIQGALFFEQKGTDWITQIDARAEIWEDGKVIASQDIKKEMVISGSKAVLDAGKSSLLLDGVALKGHFRSNDEAVLIFRSKNEKGIPRMDTIKRKFFAPIVVSDKCYLGGIELATSLTKTTDVKNPFEKFGFIITPNPSKVYGTTTSKLDYYTELYVPSSMISPTTTSTIITRVLDGQTHEMFANSHTQVLSAATVPLVGSIDIDGLPTDSYILEVVVKTGDKVEATMQKVFFYDSGMKLSEEEMDTPSGLLDEATIYAVSDLSKMAALELGEKGDQAMYIANNEQIKAWKKLKQKYESDEAAEGSATAETKPALSKQKEDDTEAERKFLFNFWRLKDKEQSSVSSMLAYKAYYRRVEEINKKFTYQKTPGWETDFGRVALRFGLPDERLITQVLHSVEAKPYITWEYRDKNIPLISGSHAIFVFLDRQGGGKFVLVHSNVQGETYEPDWYSQEASRTH
ncbi:MAG: GWxTD domain-containing protein [Ignavibacteriota bacterium]